MTNQREFERLQGLRQIAGIICRLDALETINFLYVPVSLNLAQLSLWCFTAWWVNLLNIPYSNGVTHLPPLNYDAIELNVTMKGHSMPQLWWRIFGAAEQSLVTK